MRIRMRDPEFLTLYPGWKKFGSVFFWHTDRDYTKPKSLVRIDHYGYEFDLEKNLDKTV
jgi:hypothetical protein